MLCFDEGNRRFQMRAAGIALRGGRVLAQRSTRDDFWALPGGRVEFGETAAETLRREMQEELGQTVDVGALAFTCETMFSFEARAYHEIGLYHQMAVPDAFGRSEGVCHTHREGETVLEFCWLDASPDALADAPFFPEVLRPYLIELPGYPMHFVDRG